MRLLFSRLFLTTAVPRKGFFILKIMIYNTIHHEIRNAAKLSLLDYCLLESIYLLSTGQKAKYKGWCNATKPAFDYLASTRTISTRFKYLEAKGWLIFKDDKRFLKKTSEKYFNEVYAYVLGMKKLHPKYEETSHQGMKKLHPKYEETSPNKNSNHIYNSKKESKEEKKAAPSFSEDFDAALKGEYKHNKNEGKEKEKSCEKKKARQFPDNTPRKAYKVKPPPTADESLKPYQMFLNNYPFESKGWTDEIKKEFLIYCEIRAEGGRSFSSAQIKLRLTEVNDALIKHSIKDIIMILKAAQNGKNGGWASFEFTERIKDRQPKKKHNITDNYDAVKDQLNDPNFLFNFDN